MSRVASLCLALLLVAAGVSPPAVAAGSQSTTSTTNSASTATIAGNESTARIVELYPNPVADEDSGEYVVVRLPTDGTDGGVATNWTLTDGETTATLPTNSTHTHVVTATPSALPNGTHGHVVQLTAFALANGGESLRLERNGTPVDRVSYENAPEGEQWRWNRTPTWRPIGFTPREVHVAGPATAETFVFPDASGVPVRTLRRADQRLLLAGYTFASSRVTDELVAAAERGVRVRVLVDDAPVGGMTTRQAAALNRLVTVGVGVSVIGGERARYDFHHPKYAVVDDEALVLTENWKPSGTGGRSSRGWGARVDSAETADELAATFRDDATGPDTTPWSQFRRGRSFTSTHPANGSFPTRFDPQYVAVDRVRLVTAPGNAEGAIAGVVDDASERISIIQPTIGSRHHPFLRATLRAAERGVEVRILLSGAWYVEEDNRRLVEWLNERAERRGLPLEARVADPEGRFEKIHAKGIVADDRVVVGSVNWNNNSVRENREVAVILDGEESAGYYREVFVADWKGGSGADQLPLGVVAVTALAVLVAVGVARKRIEFEEGVSR